MAVPAPVITVNPTTVTRTYADLTPAVVLTDTNTPSPAPVPPNGRSFREDGNEIAATTGTTNSVSYPVNLPAGVHAMTVRTTNADGAVTSAGVNLTVNDSTDDNNVVDLLTDDNRAQVRINPNKLPNEFLDPTLATPGLPSATAIFNARTKGTIS
jgi:hypothetical protein